MRMLSVSPTTSNATAVGLAVRALAAVVFLDSRKRGEPRRRWLRDDGRRHAILYIAHVRAKRQHGEPAAPAAPATLVGGVTLGT